jgi:hypothetical protein
MANPALAFALLLLLAAPPGFAADPEWAHEICRRHHGRTECVRWTAACDRGQDTTGPGKEGRACRALAPRECRAVAALVSGAVTDARALPPRDRAPSAAATLLCEGFVARSTTGTVAACFGKHPGGRELLYSAFRSALEVCDAAE